MAQVYLGGFDNEEQAALAYDIAAIKFRAHDANTNYNISNYEQELLHFDEVGIVGKHVSSMQVALTVPVMHEHALMGQLSPVLLVHPSSSEQSTCHAILTLFKKKLPQWLHATLIVLSECIASPPSSTFQHIQ